MTHDDERYAQQQAMADALAGYPDAVVARAIRLVAADIELSLDTVPHGVAQIQPQTKWDAMEAIAKAVMERFDRMPDTVEDVLIQELASASWCALHTGWVSHSREVRRWAIARGELLANDLAAHAASVISPVDPLDDYPADVAAGYRWHRDRSPEAVA